MRFRQIRDGAIQKANELLRYLLVDVIGSKAFIDVYLYRYSSYEEYRQVQIYHNLRKLKRVWADPQTLDLLADELVARLGSGPLRGLCHGTRNGFEQNHLNAQHPGWKVTGTDISPSAADFPNSVVWDFHACGMAGGLRFRLFELARPVVAAARGAGNLAGSGTARRSGGD